MSTEVKLPELGENITSGDLVKVLVNVGDTIAKDQAVIELETEKAAIEVPSPVGGKVTQIHVQQGQKINVGQAILSVEESGDGQPAQKAAAEKTAPAEKPPAKQAAPEGKPEAKAEQPAAEKKAAPARETPAKEPARSEPARSKAAAQPTPEEKPEPEEEPEQRPAAAQEAKPAPSRPPAAAAPGEKSGPKLVERRESVAAPQVAPSARKVVPAAPSVRQIAREIGVTIEDVEGTGPGGRITPQDVKDHAKRLLTGIGARPAVGAAAPTAPASAPLPDFTRWGEVERKPMSAVRRKTAQHLAHAWNAIPHVTQHDRADITRLEELRAEHAKQAEAAGGKLTMTAIALKVVAAALKTFPQFAASIDPASEEIIYKHYINIGVAVDTERGLLVPVLRDVERKSIIDLSVELAALAEKARNKKLTPGDMEGGVFTITNLGGIGGTHFTPIVNWPEVAILGLSRSSWEPVYRHGLFQPRLMLPLSLSYDHRLVDGADAARFLRWVCGAFEEPFMLSLQS